MSASNSSCLQQNVLVTAIGTATATTIVTELKSKGGYKVIGTDIFKEREVATSKDVDCFIRVPSSVEDTDLFLETILEICRCEKIDFYFATIDEEVALISEAWERFDALGVKLCIPNAKAVEICHNKQIFVHWIEERFPEIAIPTMHDLDEARCASYPLFIKPSVGRASLGCRTVASFDELSELLGDGAFTEDLIVQEQLTGSIMTVDIARNDLTGQFSAIPRIENLRNKNGCGIAVQVVKDEALMDICKRISCELQLHGVVNAEFFSVDGQYKIIEINPRFSAGAVFSCMSGADLVGNAISIAKGDPCADCVVRYGDFYAKRYETYRMGGC